MVRVWLHHSVSNEGLLKMKYFQVVMKPDNDGDEKVCELFLFIKTMVWAKVWAWMWKESWYTKFLEHGMSESN